MTWRASLRDASFRGVKFKVDTTDLDFGRRNILHEYPKRDIPYAEDLGKKARIYTIEAYLCVGPGVEDYLPQRDALMRAIEDDATPGTLVHPTLGAIKVIPGDCKVQFDNHSGGVERFSLTFTQAGENRYPSAQTDTKAGVLKSAETVNAAIIDGFQGRFSVDGRPAFVAQSAQGITVDSGAALSQMLSRYPSDPVRSASLSGGILLFGGQSGSLIQTPATLAQRFLTLTTTIRTVISTSQNLYLGFRGLLSFGRGYLPVPLTTDTRKQQALNQAQQVAMVRQAGIVGMAVAASTLDYASYDDAVTTRNQVTQALEVELLAVGATDNDPLYIALGGLYAQTVADITTRAASLKRVKSITLSRTIPAVVLAYDIYDDAGRAEEISARNRVRHPLFVPAGKPLEVLAA